MRSIIFDLDLTLVDSTIAEDARSRRDWPLVYSLIPQFRLYDGVAAVLEHICRNGGRVAIVSTAPSSYVQRVVNYFGIPVDTIVGYHDAARKPAPDGMLLALQRLGDTPANAVSFGDRAIDIQASNAAGIRSVACTWGTKERFTLISSHPDAVISSPSQMLNCL
ncbi:MAG: HAD family hydrolase [Bacteroidales bacterium]|nr:HAD family hydrolase [Bacteroidales bacterium]